MKLFLLLLLGCDLYLQIVEFTVEILNALFKVGIMPPQFFINILQFLYFLVCAVPFLSCFRLRPFMRSDCVLRLQEGFLQVHNHLSFSLKLVVDPCVFAFKLVDEAFLDLQFVLQFFGRFFRLGSLCSA